MRFEAREYTNGPEGRRLLNALSSGKRAFTEMLAKELVERRVVAGWEMQEDEEGIMLLGPKGEIKEVVIEEMEF